MNSQKTVPLPVVTKTSNSMRVALVHDWFNQRIGGAEQVTRKLSQMFPEAPIYTLIYNHQKFGNFVSSSRLRTSFLQKLPEGVKKQARYLLPLIPRAVGSLDLTGYNIIISNSSAFVKNIKRPSGAVHICYCNSPLRAVWDYADEYLAEQEVGNIQQSAARYISNRIRRWDYNGSKNVDYFIANSHNVAARIAQYYHRKSEVIYPPVSLEGLRPSLNKDDYYLILSGLTQYKKIDLAIEACKIGGRKLVIVGDGKDRKRLELISNQLIEFKGHVTEQVKQSLLRRAKALIFPSEEDFGITPIEAMASGTPVIAYGKGGVTETVINKRTGLFFSKQTPEGLSEAIDEFETMKFKTASLTAQAAKFDSSVFEQKLLAYVKHVSKQSEF